MGNSLPQVGETLKCSSCSSCDGSDKTVGTYGTGLTGTEEFVESADALTAATSALESPRAMHSPSSGTRGDNSPRSGNRGMRFGAVKEDQKKTVLGSMLGRITGNTAEHRMVHYDDGSMYEGQVVDGIRHGEGTYKSGSDQYTGQWEADQQHGKGKQTWNDGRSYEGQFSRGRFSGIGKMSWQSAKGTMTYEGEYVDDLKHGNGKFCWPDGRVYEGDWLRGKRHGRGAFITAKGEYKIGHWAEDRFLRWEVSGAEQDNVNQMLH